LRGAFAREGVTRTWAPAAAGLLAFALLLGLQGVTLVRMHSPNFTDDAPFFFRYAENLAAGHGFRWNVEEAPVWGASAPLWALLLALGVKLGLGAAQASLVWGAGLTLAATVLLGRVAQRLFGTLGILALAALLPGAYLHSFFATSGLESPLSYLLFATALTVATAGRSGLLLGLVAGLCLVHKLDFAPIGLALLAGVWAWRRTLARPAWLAAGAVALAWYGFAAWHFGSPLPNSFLRKLSTPEGALGPAWFGTALLWLGAGRLHLALLLPGLVALRAQRFPAAVALAGFVPQLLAYTWKTPAEPFVWYAAACSPAVAFLAACGLAWLLRHAWERVSMAALRPVAVGALLVLAGAWVLLREGPRAQAMQDYLAWIEPQRIAAGEWIARNTPADARVYSGHGHVGYHSRRFVYDGSFLNRRPEPNLVGRYEPEVLVWVLVTPADAVPLIAGYRTARIFAGEGGRHPHAVVQLRRPAHPDKAWLQALLDEVAPEQRDEARELVLDRLGFAPDERAQAPELVAEVAAALARLRARLEAAGATARAPGWLAWLAAGLTGDPANDLGLALASAESAAASR
jgi:hypothetical protein